MTDILEGVVDTFSHPERTEGEVFFSNASEKSFPLIPYISKRKGNLAYDGNGNQQTAKDWFPVFILISDLEKSNIKLVDARRNFLKKHD